MFAKTCEKFLELPEPNKSLLSIQYSMHFFIRLFKTTFQVQQQMQTLKEQVSQEALSEGEQLQASPAAAQEGHAKSIKEDHLFNRASWPNVTKRRAFEN